MTTSCPVAADPKKSMLPRLLAPVMIGAALALSPSSALANDPAAAEALFQAGKGLMDKKNYDEACPKFEASYKLDPAVGTMLNMADCYEKQGRLARAWVAWGDARDQAKRESDKPRADLAERRQKELDPRVPRLTVQVKGSVDGLAVFRDDVRLEPPSFGVPLPVDPGTHAVTLRRGQIVLKEESVESKEKGSDEVSLDATDVPPPAPEDAQANAGDPAKPQYKLARRSTGMLVGGILLGISGGVFTLGGLVVMGATDAPGAGLGVTGLGLLMLGGGITMGVIGNKKVQKKIGAVHNPELFIGPTSVMFRGQF